jgi:hypothetical protein
LKTS